MSNDVNAKMKINNQSSKFGEMLDRNEYPRCTQSKYIQEYIIIYYILIYYTTIVEEQQQARPTSTYLTCYTRLKNIPINQCDFTLKMELMVQ